MITSDFNSAVHYSTKNTNSCGVMVHIMKWWQALSNCNTTSQALLVEQNSIWDTYSIGRQTNIQQSFFPRNASKFL